MSRYCRTCLEIILPGEQFYNLNGELNDESEHIISQLESLVPQITLNVIEHAVICIYCVDALTAAYNFKSKCIETEEKIYKHILESEGPSHAIDINRVVAQDEKYFLNIEKENVICEVEIFEEKVTPFHLSEEYSVNCTNNEHLDSLAYIKTEQPELVELSDITTILSSPQTSTAIGFENNTQVSASAIHRCEDSHESNNVNKIQNDIEKSPVRPCSTVLTCVADVYHESLKQRSKLLCVLQQNSETNNCRKIRTRSSSCDNNKEAVLNNYQAYSNLSSSCKPSRACKRTRSYTNCRPTIKSTLQGSNTINNELTKNVNKVTNNILVLQDIQSTEKINKVNKKSENKINVSDSNTAEKICDKLLTICKFQKVPNENPFIKIGDIFDFKEADNNEVESPCEIFKNISRVTNNTNNIQERLEINNSSNVLKTRENENETKNTSSTLQELNTKKSFNETENQINIVDKFKTPHRRTSIKQNSTNIIQLSSELGEFEIFSTSKRKKVQDKHRRIHKKKRRRNKIKLCDNLYRIKIKRRRGRPSMKNKYESEKADGVEIDQEMFVNKIDTNSTVEVNNANKCGLNNSSSGLKSKRGRGRPSAKIKLNHIQCECEKGNNNVEIHQEKFEQKSNLSEFKTIYLNTLNNKNQFVNIIEENGKQKIKRGRGRPSINKDESSLFKIKRPRGRPSTKIKLNHIQCEFEKANNVKIHQNKLENKNQFLNTIEGNGKCNETLEVNTPSNDSFIPKIKRVRGRPSSKIKLNHIQYESEKANNEETHQKEFENKNQFLNTIGGNCKCEETPEVNTPSNRSFILNIKRGRGRPSINQHESRNHIQCEPEKINNVKTTHQEKFENKNQFLNTIEGNNKCEETAEVNTTSNDSFIPKMKRGRGRPSTKIKLNHIQCESEKINNVKTTHQEKFENKNKFLNTIEGNGICEKKTEVNTPSNGSFTPKIKRLRGRPSTKIILNHIQCESEKANNEEIHQKEFENKNQFLNTIEGNNKCEETSGVNTPSNGSFRLKIKGGRDRASINKHISSLFKIKRSRGRPSTKIRNVETTTSNSSELKIVYLNTLNNEGQFLNKIEINNTDERTPLDNFANKLEASSSLS